MVVFVAMFMDIPIREIPIIENVIFVNMIERVGFKKDVSIHMIIGGLQMHHPESMYVSGGVEGDVKVWLYIVVCIIPMDDRVQSPSRNNAFQSQTMGICMCSIACKRKVSQVPVPRVE